MLRKQHYLCNVVLHKENNLSRNELPGPFIYGKVQGAYGQYKADVERAAQNGMVLLIDAIDARGFYAGHEDYIVEVNAYNFKQLEQIGDFRMGMCEDSDYATCQNLEHMIRAAKNTKKDKLEVGDMFEVGVADGWASYVVVNVRRKLCDVEWRGFCPDHYIDRMFGYGGSYRIQDILPLVGKIFPMKRKTPLDDLEKQLDCSIAFYESRWSRQYTRGIYVPK